MRQKVNAKQSPIRNTAGFTILEVMISLVIFTVALLGMFGLSGTTWNDTGCAETFTGASVQASRHVEAIFSRRYIDEDPMAQSSAIYNGWHQTVDGPYTIRYLVTDGGVLRESKSIQMNVNFACGGRPKTVRYNYVIPMRTR